MGNVKTIGELIAMYRKYKKLDARTFGEKVFLTGDTLAKIEQGRDDEVSDNALLRFYQFFNVTTGVADVKEAKTMLAIANVVRAEMRKRAEAKALAEAETTADEATKATT